MTTPRCPSEGERASPTPGQAGSVANSIGGGWVNTSVQAGRIGTVHFHGVPEGPPVPAQLQPLPATWTDRDDDMTRLRRWLSAQPDHCVRVIAISGPGGVGKSAFATRLLHEVGDSFPGGQVYADLRASAPEGPAGVTEILGRFLRAFRTGPLPVGREELSAWWRSVTAALSDRPVAVLLDNAVDADQVRTLLPGGRGHLVVCTSRPVLSGLAPDGAALHELQPLSRDAAREYLARCVGVDRVAREPDAAQLLVTLSAGMPLFMAVVASHLAEHPTRSLAAGAIALTELSQSLAVTGHTHSYGAIMDNAYAELPRTARVVYQVASLLPVPDLDTALCAAACAMPHTEADRALVTLVQAHLLERLGEQDARGQVYRFHDEVRAHARQCAAAEMTDTLADESVRRALEWAVRTTTEAERLLTSSHRRLARTYRHQPIQETQFADHGAAESWLQAQHTNLLALIRAAHSAGHYDSAWQQAHSMWPYWRKHRTYDLWVEAHKLGLDAARKCGDREAVREMDNTLGVGLRGAGLFDAAIDCFNRVLKTAQQDNDERSEAQALHELGATHLEAHRVPDAEPFLFQAREKRDKAGYARGVALTDILLGRAALSKDRFENAITRFTQARTVLLEVPDPHDASRALAYQGLAEARAGDVPNGERNLRLAHQEFAEAGTPHWSARTLEWLGLAVEEGNRPQEARDFYTQALDRYRPISTADAARVQERLERLA